MKNTTCKASFLNRPCVPVPNAATNRQILDRAVETLLVMATGAGMGALVLFATTLLA